jgi:hypothetical protein
LRSSSGLGNLNGEKTLKNDLSVLVRLDVSRACAVLEVKGSVTAANTDRLLPLVERTRKLAGITSVEADFSFASSIEPEALAVLRRTGCKISTPMATELRPRSRPPQRIA